MQKRDDVAENICKHSNKYPLSALGFGCSSSNANRYIWLSEGLPLPCER